MSEQDVYKELAELESEIQRLGDEQRQCEAEVRRLLEAEAAGEGCQAAAIHQLKQKKMMLGTQMQHLRARASALKLGIY